MYKGLYKHLLMSGTSASSVVVGANTPEMRAKRGELRNEFRQNAVTASRYCMAKDEMMFLGSAYLTYLDSTKRTIELYGKYAKGERSIEESARIVGLKPPKLYQEPTPST